MLEQLKQYVEEPTLLKIRNIILIIVFGYALLQLVMLVVRRLFWKNLKQQSRMILSKTILYTGFSIIILLILKELNVKVGAILGAAGVVGVIIGFASQTSIGNIISGLFIISEKSYEIGDLIRVGDKMGVVYSIDLLSLKLKTLDNLLIRIPNQTLISTEVTNITRFPIRRMDIDIGVAYKEDLGKVINVLKKLATENPNCLDEPEPLILIKNYGDSSINILYGLWFEKSNYVTLRNSIMQEILNAFREEGIEIPFPHISLYTGEATKPFPVEFNSNSK
ncbi:MAG: mechanosensitive ion channel family protein [Bacteroidales bacterium]|nr:mechanosensitive ion channel family protein [Bacteroidales bacterium]